MRVASALGGVSLLCIDSSPLNVYVAGEPNVIGVLAQVFRRLETGELFGVTTSLTLTEIFVHVKATDDAETEAQYRKLIFGPTIQRIPVDDIIAESASELRARYRLNTPDAVQIATALEANCDAFLTNDAALSRVTEIPVLVVSRLRL